MADPISDLRAAGFGDAEIGAWTAQKRGELSAAGFKDNEIDAYFVGGPVVREDVPPALEARIQAGNEAKKRQGGLLQTIPQFFEMMGSPEGRAKLGESLKSYPGHFAEGMIDTTKVPGDVYQGKVDLSTEEGMEKAIGLGTLVGFGRLSKLPKTAKTSGLSVSTGAEELARIDRGPTGEVVEVPIGGLPKSEDFVTAAKTIAGDEVPPAVQDKLLKLYDEQGIHPAEAAHDAASDVTVKQSILSSADDLPSRYAPSLAEQRALAAIDEMKRVASGEPEAAVTAPAEAAVAETSPRMPRAATLGDTAPVSAADRVLSAAEDVKSLAEGGGEGKPPMPPKSGDGTPPAEPPSGGGDPQQVILDKINVGGKDKRSKLSWDKLYTETVDNLHPIKGVSEDAYQLARLTRGQFAKAQHFLEHGTFNFTTFKTNGKALKQILEPIKDDLNGWRAYAAAKRAVELEGRGVKSGMDLEAAQKVIAEGADKYEGITKELSQYQNKLVDYLKNAGVLSDEAVAAMREANQAYIPFFRVMGEVEASGKGVGKSFGPGSPIKRIEGSDRAIIDPLESIIKNTYTYISVAERNAVGIKIIDALKKAGHEVETTKLPAKDAELSAYLAEKGIKTGDDLAVFVRGLADDGETISAYRNGKKETVKIDDPDLVRAFRGLDNQNLDLLTRILAVPARTLRAGAVLTPDFIARNLVRDFTTAFINTKGGVFTPIDTAKGLKSVIAKDADFQTWLKSGGANATMVSLDRRYMQESLAKLSGETGLMDRAWNVVNSPIRGLRMMSELAENATRVGEFKKVLKGSEAKEDIQAAGFASREVTLDFARIGASMRAYNAITAFANAQIQGTDRIVRAFKDRPFNTTAKVAGGITLPSVLLWWANHDDPRYKELPAWQKDLFWIILTKEHIYRIPKPFELGVTFGSGVERALDATVGKNPEAFAHFNKSIMDVLSPNFVPTAAAPIVDQFANRSTFTDRTLIPHSMERFLPEYQYTEYTTETSKALGRIVAGFPGIREASMSDDAGIAGGVTRAVTSPILIENYTRAWTGGLGMYAINTVDYGLRKAGIVPDPVKPEDTLADIPVVKAFVVRYPSASAQSIQDFYDMHERNKRYFDTWMAKAKEGDLVALDRIQAAGGPQIFFRMDEYQRSLAEHSKLVRMVYKSPEFSPAEKRQAIDQLYYMMIETAKTGKQSLIAVEQALKGH